MSANGVHVQASPSVPWQDPSSDNIILEIVKRKYGEGGVPPRMFYAFPRPRLTKEERAEVVAALYPGVEDRNLPCFGGAVNPSIRIEVHGSRSPQGYAIGARDPAVFACSITVGGTVCRVFQIGEPEGIIPYCGDDAGVIDFLKE